MAPSRLSTLALALSAPQLVAAGSLTFFSNDLVTSKPTLDNVKATYDTKIGDSATLSVVYNAKAKKDFLAEAKLAGSMPFVDKVKYALTQNFVKSTTGVTLSTSASGVTLKASGDSGSKMVTSVSASGSAKVGGTTVSYEPSYAIKSETGKLKLAADIGSTGVDVSAEVSASVAGDFASSFELGYGTELGEGCALSASVRPADMAGEVEYADKTFEKSAIWIASADLSLGGRPKLAVRRAAKF